MGDQPPTSKAEGDQGAPVAALVPPQAPHHQHTRGGTTTTQSAPTNTGCKTTQPTPWCCATWLPHSCVPRSTPTRLRLQNSQPPCCSCNTATPRHSKRNDSPASCARQPTAMQQHCAIPRPPQWRFCEGPSPKGPSKGTRALLHSCIRCCAPTTAGWHRRAQRWWPRANRRTGSSASATACCCGQ